MAAKTKSVTILIAILIMLAFIGIFASLYLTLVAGRTTLINVYGINASIISSDDYRHSVKADFALEINSSYSKKIDSQYLRRIIKEAIETLDYDKFKAADNTEYIKEEVSNYISDVVPKEQLKAIYISRITTDIMDSNEQSNEAKSKSDVYEGMFEKIR